MLIDCLQIYSLSEILDDQPSEKHAADKIAGEAVK
jgi:hypothetical protein